MRIKRKFRFMKKILLVFCTLCFMASAQAIKLEEDTKVKIAYSSPETNRIGAVLDIYVTDSVMAKDERGLKKVVIPAGTKGKLTITRLGGLNEDIIMETQGVLNLKSGKKVRLNHYKTKRKKTRTVIKVARTASVFTPIGAASTAVGIAYKRGKNKYNLPQKMFTAKTERFN